MANVREVAEIIAEKLGAPLGTVRHVARRLGEASLLGPRNARGRAAPDLNWEFTAYLIVGVMAVADGLGEGTVQVGKIAQRVATLAKGTTGKADIYRDNKTGEVIVEYGSIIDAISHLLKINPTLVNEKNGSVGLTIDAAGIRAWVENITVSEDGKPQVSRITFGASANETPRGLKRDIVLSFSDIAAITSEILARRRGDGNEQIVA